MNHEEIKGYDLLIRALLSLRNEQECEAFLEDLMTKKEMIDISQRLLVAQMLSRQTVYNKIVEETGASTATISRVNRSYHYGAGGYADILERLKEEK